MVLELRNPHSVLAALQTRPQAVLEIQLSADRPPGIWSEVIALAQRHTVPVVRERPRRGRASSASSSKSGRLTGIKARVRERPAASLESLFAVDGHSQNEARLWLALDCLQDPHNVGAIFRSAAFFGVQGIVVTKDRSAPLNAAVYDVASGGLEYTPFAQETNLSRTLEKAKATGLWILGACERAEKDVTEIATDRPWLLVLGNEEKGLRRLTRQRCDEFCRITSHGPVSSLNVSVAAGVLMSRLISHC